MAAALLVTATTFSWPSCVRQMAASRDVCKSWVPVCAQALVQFPDPVSASNAKQALEGHAIYDGGYNKVSSVETSLEQGEQRRDLTCSCPVSQHVQQICRMPSSDAEGFSLSVPWLTQPSSRCCS